MLTTQDQENLREAMRRSTDPRWVERQLCNDYDDPGEDIIISPKPWRWLMPLTLGLIVGGILLSLALIVLAVRSVQAAEKPTERAWIVWNVGADAPWLSKKGLPATATGPTACNLSLHEVSKASPSGTRLACKQRKEQ